MRASEFIRVRWFLLYPVYYDLHPQHRTVDDNTGIVECHHKDLVTPFSPSKRRDRKFQGFNYPPLPPPVTYIGRPVIVTGRVCRGRKIYLIVESIGGYRHSRFYRNLTVGVASTVQVLQRRVGSLERIPSFTRVTLLYQNSVRYPQDDRTTRGTDACPAYEAGPSETPPVTYPPRL